MFTFLSEKIVLYQGREENNFGYSRKEEGVEIKKEKQKDSKTIFNFKVRKILIVFQDATFEIKSHVKNI